MKVLVSTEQTQGERKSDFCWVPEDEILTFGFECDADRGKIDGGCGCRRSFSGVECKKATTTAKVIERDDLTVGKLSTLLFDSLLASGWAEMSSDRELRHWAERDAQEMARLADHFNVGDVIEKRGQKIQSRVR
jgi:hypothetical protein